MTFTPEDRAELARLARTNPAVRKLLRRKVQLSMIVDDVFDIGIYPQAIIYPDGREDRRTEWQDGHNAAVLHASGIITRRLR